MDVLVGSAGSYSVDQFRFKCKRDTLTCAQESMAIRAILAAVPVLASARKGGSWEHVADAPWSTRGHFGAVTTENGTMLITGGMHTADNTHLQDVWASQDGRSWEQLTEAAPWPERHRHGMLFFNGCSYWPGTPNLRIMIFRIVNVIEGVPGLGDL